MRIFIAEIVFSGLIATQMLSVTIHLLSVNIKLIKYIIFQHIMLCSSNWSLWYRLIEPSRIIIMNAPITMIHKQQRQKLCREKNCVIQSSLNVLGNDYFTTKWKTEFFRCKLFITGGTNRHTWRHIRLIFICVVKCYEQLRDGMLLLFIILLSDTSKTQCDGYYISHAS